MIMLLSSIHKCYVCFFVNIATHYCVYLHLGEVVDGDVHDNSFRASVPKRKMGPDAASEVHPRVTVFRLCNDYIIVIFAMVNYGSILQDLMNELVGGRPVSRSLRWLLIYADTGVVFRTGLGHVEPAGLANQG